MALDVLIPQGGRLVIAEEVEHALQQGGPVVALESTIITHGPSLRLCLCYSSS